MPYLTLKNLSRNQIFCNFTISGKWVVLARELVLCFQSFSGLPDTKKSFQSFVAMFGVEGSFDIPLDRKLLLATLIVSQLFLFRITAISAAIPTLFLSADLEQGK